jgi:hypothetical protein
MARQKIEKATEENPLNVENNANPAEGSAETTIENLSETPDEEPNEEQAPQEQAPQNEPKRPRNAPKAEVAENTIKKVKIHTTDPIDCLIANVHYTFLANRDAQVPADVAAILVNAKKAFRM